MNRLLLWITQYLPCRVISDNGMPYLERYYLFTLMGWRFYIHRFVGSDPAQGLHDHPWRKAYSLILSGWYWEETRSGKRKVRWFNSLTGDTFHRVILPKWRKLQSTDSILSKGKRFKVLYAYGNAQPCWTLFAHTVGDVKPWGFLRPVEWDSGKGAIFHEYTYEREGGKDQQWWLTAPKGREFIRT